MQLIGFFGISSKAPRKGAQGMSGQLPRRCFLAHESSAKASMVKPAVWTQQQLTLAARGWAANSPRLDAIATDVSGPSGPGELAVLWGSGRIVLKGLAPMASLHTGSSSARACLSATARKLSPAAI